MTTIDCEIYLACNESGGWVVSNDDSDALGRLAFYQCCPVIAESMGGTLARVVKVTVKMTPPVMAEATVTVPDEAGTVQAVAS